MTAVERISKMSAAYQSELTAVREEYSKMPVLQTQLLMRRHGFSNAQDAYSHEAKMRLKRNAWAEVQS